MVELLWFLFGACVGATLFKLLFSRPVGVLKIDNSNPEKDLYRFEVDNLDKLSKKKQIVLHVKKDIIDSQN